MCTYSYSLPYSSSRGLMTQYRMLSKRYNIQCVIYSICTPYCQPDPTLPYDDPNKPTLNLSKLPSGASPHNPITISIAMSIIMTVSKPVDLWLCRISRKNRLLSRTISSFRERSLYVYVYIYICVYMRGYIRGAGCIYTREGTNIHTYIHECVYASKLSY